MTKTADDSRLDPNQFNDLGRLTTNALVEWYWEFGIKRQGHYAISPVWLNNLYKCRDLLHSIERGRANRKASLGLWGPSQSGKSTLISQFVDHGADESGKGGALHWNTPALFSSHSEFPDDVIVFNPHNLGSDASGCVSRFVLRAESEVPFPDCPVEMELLTSAQLMHAISAGYYSECQTEQRWTVDRLEELLEKYAISGSPTAVDRRAFEQLHEVIDVIDLLVGARDDRFSQLDAGGKWASLLSQRILEAGALRTDLQKVNEFAATLLWDAQPALTRLFERLARFRARFPSGRIYCSLEVAATLVNIESFRIFQSTENKDDPPGTKRIRDTIRKLSRETHEGKTVLGTMFATKALEQDEDFGLLQGLVRELIIPLRHRPSDDGTSGAKSFFKFMEQAELVDFPGVPLRDRNVKENLLDLTVLPNADDPRLLTEVLKRGKVASLVIGYSRSLSLDSFMLLVRAGQFAAKPEQLHRGLIAWWSYVDPTYDVNDVYCRNVRRPPLPLYFNLTFFANIIDKIANRLASTGLDPLLSMVKQLDPLVEPRVCTMLATTYPQFIKEGKIDVSPDKASSAVQFVLKDSSFGPRMRDSAVSRESLNQMVTQPDGGVGYVFQVLVNEVSTRDRLRLLDARHRNVLGDVRALVEEQSPREANDVCRRDVAALKEAVETALRERLRDSTVIDPAAWVSYRLRQWLDVNPEILQPLPAAGQLPQKYADYVHLQLNKWLESKATVTGLQEIGVSDSALRARLLGFLSERVQVKEIARWIREELPQNRNREDSSELRRALAIMLSNHLTHTKGRADKHPALDGKEGVIATIRQWATDEDKGSESYFEASPHYVGTVRPILELFEELAQGQQGTRPPQPGDKEATDLLHALKACSGS